MREVSLSSERYSLFCNITQPVAEKGSELRSCSVLFFTTKKLSAFFHYRITARYTVLNEGVLGMNFIPYGFRNELYLMVLISTFCKDRELSKI